AREIGDSAIRAYVGPCIRECCYEVSEELAQEFARRFGSEAVSGRNLSLPAAIQADLERAQVVEVFDLGLCTGCRPDLFYSHRKQGPLTGRSLAAVAKVGL
ncbi:MAG: polyphenol oxidase family protein, partial [Rubrobacter sp.]|nr:polyphenol oxidase family protein [Rubrobacter sp.]